MAQVIVFQPLDAPVSVLHPVDCGLSLLEIGVKDVPEGLPFWIVDRSDVPADRVLRNAWQIDAESMGEPSGFGGQS